MEKPIVLIDMDGVLVDSLPYWLRVYNYKTGENVNINDITTYDFTSHVGKPNKLIACLYEDNVFQYSEPMPDAVKALELFIKLFDTKVLTYVVPECIDGELQKRRWLVKHCPKFDLVNFMSASSKNKVLVDGDYMVEDNPLTLNAWCNVHPGGRGFLVSHRYNHNVQLHSNISVVESLEEAFFEIVTLNLIPRGVKW